MKNFVPLPVTGKYFLLGSCLILWFDLHIASHISLSVYPDFYDLHGDSHVTGHLGFWELAVKGLESSGDPIATLPCGD